MTSYRVADADGKRIVINSLNRDLSLKINNRQVAKLNLENYENLFQEAKISVLVNIQGDRQVTGKYTLFWAQFTGVDQRKIIGSRGLEHRQLAVMRLPICGPLSLQDLI